MNNELKDMTADQLEQLLEQKRAEERQAADAGRLREAPGNRNPQYHRPGA